MLREQILGILIGWFVEVPQKTPPSSGNFSGRQTTPSPILYNLLSSEKQEMSVSVSSNINCLNTVNNYTVADESRILTWLSPLEPGIRHQDIQERRVEHVGEWLLKTDEFRNWYASGGRGGSGNAVLFSLCIGAQFTTQFSIFMLTVAVVSKYRRASVVHRRSYSCLIPLI